MRTHLTIAVLAVLLSACGDDARRPADVRLDTQAYQQIQEQLIMAEPGTVVEIPEGTFEFDRPLSLDGISGITLRGVGMDKTILSFKGQVAGAEGIKVTADSFTLADLTIVDTKGDAVKVQDSKAVTFRNVKTTWSDGPRETNGGYGLYPVACDGVLVDGCEASYASDAGIYIGQSRNVVVRNSYAHENVAGIEIENCTGAEVYDCLAENNTGGILVFDLPELPAGNGRSCKVYNNRIIENNHRNFAPEGNIVATVAPGTGIILLAAKDVEVYNNEIIGHKTMGAAIASYQITQLAYNDPNYDPFTYDVYFHDNTFERKRALPDLSKDFGKMVNFVFKGKPQDILYDGIIDDSRDSGPNPMNVCVRETGADLRFANIDAANDFENVQTDMALYNCQREAMQ